MASIEPKPTGGYAVRWREGHSARQQTCSSRRDAERVKREVEAALAVGKRWDPAAALRAPRIGDSVAGASDGALSAYLGACRRKGMKQSSLDTVYYTLTAWLKWLDARLKRAADLGDLELPMLEAYHDHLSERCQPRHAWRTIRQIERAWRWWADRDEYADHTPRPRKMDLAPAPAALAPYSLAWADVDQVVERARRHDPRASWQWKALTLQRYTGLRIGQACRLKWSDLDFGAALLTIRPELGKTRQERRGRVVPVPQGLLAEVSGWGRREGLITGRDTPSKPRGDTLRAFWTKAGYSPEQVPQPTHAIRRTYITELIAAGVDRAVLAYLVGHEAGLAQDVYAARDAALREAARAAVKLVPAIGANPAPARLVVVQ